MHADGLTQLLIEYRYWILVPLAFAEGPLVALSAGLLAALGYFNALIVFAVLLVRDFLMDGFYYGLGRFGNRDRLIDRYGSKIGITREHWQLVERLWDKHPGKTMFLSKLAYGLSIPFMISAGLSRVRYTKFWFHAIQVTVVQYGILMALGYFFGQSSYALLASSVQVFEYIIAGIVLLSIGFFFFTKYMQRKLLEEERQELERDEHTI